MKFSLAGKAYDAADLDLVPLRDILLFEQQTKDMGRELSWAQIGAWSDELDAMKKAKKSEDEMVAHPGTIWLMAVTVWATRRLAGEDLTFEEAVNFPMRDFEYVNEPAKASAAKANPTKPTRPRSASARAASTAEPAVADTSSQPT